MIANNLKKGDVIGIISPSSYIKGKTRLLIEKAVEKFKEMGLTTVFSKNCFGKDKYGVSSGSPKERAEDFNEMFSNTKIKAIYCSQGGETTNEILKYLDFEIISQNPKIFLGMSDVDIIHYAINKKTGLIVFNATDPKIEGENYLGFDYSLKCFKERLFDKSFEVKNSSDRKCVRKGVAEGKIIGCNLISLTKLSGTEFFPCFEETILFLESQELNVPKAIFELEHLKQLGIFEKIKGIVIGYMVNFQDKEKRMEKKIGVDFEDLVLEATKEYDFPILKINDFGHNSPNCCLPIGARVRINAEKKEVKIIEDFLK